MKLSPPLQQVDRTYVLAGRRKLSYFAGCDYFRMASHPRVLQAVSTGLKLYGLNVSASRVTTGNHQLYDKLEQEIASFFDAESATLASNGYLPNLMVAQALAGQFSHALIDERAHGSLTDAAEMLKCPVLKFKHRDPADLERQIMGLGKTKPLVLTDGMFAHDGAIAPIQAYLAALPAGGMILLDDAHGGGVLGPDGQGSAAHAGVPTKRMIRTITLSKAFGVYGGAVLGPAGLRSAMIERSHIFVGNTALPLPLANAAIESLRIVKTDRRMRARLLRNVARVKTRLLAGGLPVTDSPSPIISLTLENADAADRVSQQLLAKGIHPPFIKYPGAPGSGFFRFAISSEHSQVQLEELAEVLVKVRSFNLNPALDLATKEHSAAEPQPKEFNHGRIRRRSEAMADRQPMNTDSDRTEKMELEYTGNVRQRENPRKNERI